jgi:endonuclease IV
MGRIRLGLKLGSTNISYFTEAVRVIKNGYCQFIELFAVPDSFERTIHVWERLRRDTAIRFVIHASHSVAGLNFADPKARSKNRALAQEAFRFADQLASDMVVFHPGVDGNIDETISQMEMLEDERILVENKPFRGLKDERCLGFSPRTISEVMESTRCRFCFDFGHAICAANSLQLNPLEYIDEFLALHPFLFHLTDGDFSGEYDQHEHYGKGSYPLSSLLERIPPMSMVTNEAKKDFKESLDDFVQDSRKIYALLS